MKILVIIPAYNEEESILTTVQTLKNVHPEVDAIVVNDASKDNTKKNFKRKSYTLLRSSS